MYIYIYIYSFYFYLFNLIYIYITVFICVFSLYIYIFVLFIRPLFFFTCDSESHILYVTGVRTTWIEDWIEAFRKAFRKASAKSLPQRTFCDEPTAKVLPQSFGSAPCMRRSSGSAATVGLRQCFVKGFAEGLNRFNRIELTWIEVYNYIYIYT